MRETVDNVAEASVAGNVALILDCSEHEGAKIVRKRGEVILAEAPWARRTELYAHNLLNTIFFHYFDVRSDCEWEPPRQPDDFRHRSIFGNFETPSNGSPREK
jgi:hypothetical protein